MTAFGWREWGECLSPTAGPFRRLRINTSENSASSKSITSLTAEEEHEGWSLLGWSGRFNYLGQFHFFPLLDGDLPRAWADIEPFTRRFLTDYGAPTVE